MNQQRPEHIHVLAILWYLFAVLINLCMPGLYQSVKLQWTVYERFYHLAWLAWLSASLMTCTCMSALLNRPLKHRFPLGAFAVAGLVLSLMSGEQMTQESVPPGMWLALPISVMAYFISFGFLWYYGLTRGWVVDFVSNLPIKNKLTFNQSSQVSIRYLLVGTMLIVLTIALTKNLFSPGRYFFDLAGLLITICLTLVLLLSVLVVTTAVLHLALNDDVRQRTNRLRWLTLSVLISPLAIWFASVFLANIFRSPNASPPLRIIADFLGYFGCYVVALWVVMHVFSLAGLRIVRRY